MSPQATFDLELSVVIAARPATIFAFFKDPARFSEWLSAQASFEPRAGSSMRIEFPPNGSPDCPEGSVMAGEVLQVDDERHFAFSWGHEGGEHEAVLPAGASRIDITLAPHDDGTLVTLRHSGLPSEEQAQKHTPGWRYFVCQLSLKATRVQLAAAAQASVDTWFDAWGESDTPARVGLLEKAFSATGTFQDDYALVEGREALSAHIGASQVMMPGLALQSAGPVQICHSNVRFPWKVTDGQGNVLFAGINFGEVDLDGRLKKLVGFPNPPAGVATG